MFEFCDVVRFSTRLALRLSGLLHIRTQSELTNQTPRPVRVRPSAQCVRRRKQSTSVPMSTKYQQFRIAPIYTSRSIMISRMRGIALALFLDGDLCNAGIVPVEMLGYEVTKCDGTNSQSD